MTTTGIRIRVCDWNIGGHSPKDDLINWLGLDEPDLPIVAAVGLQETSEKNAWSAALLKVFNNKDFVRVKTRTLGWLLLQVFVQRSYLKYIGNVESERTRRGHKGLTTNRGALSVRMDLFGADVVFVNCHFEPHLEKKLELAGTSCCTQQDYEEILASQKFRDEDVDYILEHDYIFWSGDLNFRINTLTKEDIETKIKERDFKALLQSEQLTLAREKNVIFRGFEEGELNFPPTYKFDRGTDTYDTSSKQQKPAWCSRILWKVHKNSPKGVGFAGKQLSYKSHPQYRRSDHKPISAVFEIQVQKNPPHLPVQFHPVEDWKPDKDGFAYYTYTGPLEVTKYDWIGVFRHDFKHFNDYETRKFVTGIKNRAKKGNQMKIVFTDDKSNELSGNYILGYYSKVKNCLMGYSCVFEIRPKPKSTIPMLLKYQPKSHSVQTCNALAHKGLAPFRVRVCSWNVANSPPPVYESMDSWLGFEQEQLPGLVVVGLQEMEDKTDWCDKFIEMFGEKDYVCVKSRHMYWLLILLFVQRKNLRYIMNVESERTKTGFGGLMGTKGGVSVRFDLFGIDTIFVDSHFQAYQNNVEERIEDYEDILGRQSFRDPDTERLLDHHYVFWFGDLNFRIDDLDKAEVENRIAKGQSHSLLPYDQLNKAREAKKIFQEFEEATIGFPPTYKFDLGTDQYDTSHKQRKPAWCDRVLWKVDRSPDAKTKFDAQLVSYSSHPELNMSDHKPVSAELDVWVLKEAPQLPVEFYEVGEWVQGTEERAEYHYPTTTEKFQVSRKDWIGLLRADFCTFDHVLVHQHVDHKDKKTHQRVKFSKHDLEEFSGMFVLVYFSEKKNCMVGYSNVFEIKPRPMEGERKRTSCLS